MVTHWHTTCTIHRTEESASIRSMHIPLLRIHCLLSWVVLLRFVNVLFLDGGALQDLRALSRLGSFWQTASVLVIQVSGRVDVENVLTNVLHDALVVQLLVKEALFLG